jgi:hypothetical protein
VTHGLPNHHVTQLTTSTISNNTFYIILHSTHCSSHQSGNSTNKSLNTSTTNALFPERISTCNLENTSSYQSCRMNKSRHWGRPLHGVSEPDMLSNLCTFSQSTTLEEKTNKVTVFCRCSYCSNQSSISRT